MRFNTYAKAILAFAAVQFIVEFSTLRFLWAPVAMVIVLCALPPSKPDLKSCILSFFAVLLMSADALRLFQGRTTFWGGIVGCTLAVLGLGISFRNKDRPPSLSG
jgi:hypothetical protein